MKPENAIEVRNVTKSFKVYLDKGSTIKEKVLFRNRRRYEERQVLKDISFDVKKGEAIGLIGHNGCGKSTTLKLLTKIMYPDSGTIEMRGRVSSLIELGAGFHPDMSGRENIYINASIFGLSKKEIDNRLDDIIAFSELEDYIDNPVRTYSSGMYMRLAFSVAINVDADILLIDEILAVGDVNFQAKCFERLKEIKKLGTTIVIVSHSLPQIEQICERSLWIDNGYIYQEGVPKYVHEHYLETMENIRIEKKIEKSQKEKKNIEVRGKEEAKEEVQEVIEKTKKQEVQNAVKETAKKEVLPSFCSELSIRIGNRDIEFTNIRLTDLDNNDKVVFKNGEAFEVHMEYAAHVVGLEANFGIGIFRDDGVHVYGTNTVIEHDHLVVVNPEGKVNIIIHDNCLLPGRYMLDVAIHSIDGVRYDDIRNVTPFEIVARKKDIGICRLDNEWEVDGKKLAKRSYGD